MNNKFIKILFALIGFTTIGYFTISGNIKLEGSLTQENPLFFKEIPKDIKAKFEKNLDSEFKNIASNKSNFERFSVLNSIALGDILNSNLNKIQNVSDLTDLNPSSSYLIISSDLNPSQIGSLLRSSKVESKNTLYDSLEFLDLLDGSLSEQTINSESYIHNRKNLIILEIEDFKDLAFTEYASLFNRKLFYKSLVLDQSNDPDAVNETLSQRYQDFITKVLKNRNKQEIKFLLNGVYNSENKSEIASDLEIIEENFLNDDLDDYKKATILRQMLKLESKKDLNSLFLSEVNQFESDVLSQLKTINALNLDFSNTRSSNLFKNSELESFDPSFARQIKENTLNLYIIENDNNLTFETINENQLLPDKTLQFAICDEDSLSESCSGNKLVVKTFQLETDSENLQLNFDEFKGLYLNSNIDLVEYSNLIQNSEKILSESNLNSYLAGLDALLNQSKNLKIKFAQNLNKDTAFTLLDNTGTNLFNTFRACEITGRSNCLSNASKANFHYLLRFEKNQMSLINIRKSEDLASKITKAAFNKVYASNPVGTSEFDITIPSIQVKQPDIKELVIPSITQVDNTELTVPFIPQSQELITPPFISDNKNEFITPPFIKPEETVIIPPFVANMLFGRPQLATIPFIMTQETIVAVSSPIVSTPTPEPTNSETEEASPSPAPASGRRSGGGGGGGGGGGSTGGSRGSAETGFVPCVEILPYTDVAPSDPNYFKYIWAFCNEIFTGRTNKDGSKTLEPNAFFNRAEFAKIGVTLFQAPIVPYNRANKLFLDIEKDNAEWYMDYLNTGKGKGIITGYTGGDEKGKFLPENRISFAETVAISFRSGVDPKLVGNIKKVPWYSDLIVNYKKLEAVGKNTPGETQITRKQAILIIYDLWTKGVFGDKFN